MSGAGAGAGGARELQMEILMEKLRSKSSQYKSLQETSKAVRMNMLDKRWGIDSADRQILQKCLDNLQHCIKVSSLQSLKERLECLSRQLGLKFMVGASGGDLFISSDMFYLEILLEESGDVKDVKIHHEGKIEQQSCEELVSSISRGDFSDFTAQLEGLTAVYQLNAEKKVKCKAFSALQSLEADLGTLGQLQAFIKDPWAQVHKSPIGFLQKRRGGHAMRLTYFVSPYELLDKDKGLQPLSLELLTLGRPSVQSGLASLVAPSCTPIGHSATVLLEGSTSNKLQVSPIISVGARPMGKSGPIYAPLGLQNSSMLPACFTLKLSAPMPLCTGLARLIHATTEVECAGDWNNARPLLGLVVQHVHGKLAQGRNFDLNISRGLFVNLPEQTQCYLVCEGRGLEGCVVSSVPFTHPSHVPQLLLCLRQQALFNTLVASCVRLQSRHGGDLENMLMLEMSALSWQHISISLEHPLDESLATVELDLTDTSAPRASVYTLQPHQHNNVDEYITRVLNKSHSIPVTMRALIKVWEREAAAKQLNGGYTALDNSNFSLGLGALDPGGGDIKQEPGGGGQPGRALYPTSVSHPHQGAFLSDAQQNLSMLSQDTMVSGAGAAGAGGTTGVREESRPKKRKSDGETWPMGKRGKQVICEVQLDSSDSTSSEGSDNEDDAAVSNSSEEEGEGAGEEESQEEGSQGVGEGERNDSEEEDVLRNSFHKAEHKKQKHKKDDGRKSTSSLLLDLTEGKSFMPSSVSITPIGSSTSSSSTTSTGSNLSSVLCLDRRPGIEIIPIQSAPPAALPSSITITPISTSEAKSMEERHRSEKKSKSDERRKEKKKKKREDPMGPPDKLPPKQDPLTKPVSVSIKPTDGSISVRPSSPSSLIRKFSPSPTHGRSVSITKSPSPSNIKMSSHHSSPRHSPVQNSPKHLSGYSSPKNHSTSSPKHSSGGSGKPSMSALKSAASGSPSGKSTSSYDLSKPNKSSSSKDREKHSSSPKIKSTSVKLKQLEITPIPSDSVVSEPLVSPPNVEMKSSTPSQVRNRKSSLSAVIDKLKSAQHCGTEVELTNSSSSSTNKNNTNKNQEYMVKPSSDGMKITINKTRTKESSSSSKQSFGSSSSNSSSVKQSTSPQLTAPSQGSPKTHTGLKPGVMSGPASKKTQVMQSTKPSAPPSTTSKSSTNINNLTSSSANSGSAPKLPYTKPSSSSSSSMSGMNLSKSSSKTSSGSPKSSSNTDITKLMREREREREKSRMKSSGGEKSVFLSKERHSSPGGTRDELDGDRNFKTLPKEANFLVEGLMKPLDTSKFQIPKLKNQTTQDKMAPGSQFDNRSVNDFSARSLEHGKYPFPHTPNARNSPDLVPKSNYPLNVPKPLMNIGSSSPKTNLSIQNTKEQERPLEFTTKSQDTKTEMPQRLQVKDENVSRPEHSSSTERAGYVTNDPYKPVDPVKGFSVPKMGLEERKGVESSMKPPASGVVARSGATQEAAEMLLDFSSSSGSKVSGVVAVRPVYPTPPAHALHLVKSPIPSPLIVPSPHSNSPCITDDELMDEALVGPGK